MSTSYVMLYIFMFFEIITYIIGGFWEDIDVMHMDIKGTKSKMKVWCCCGKYLKLLPIGLLSCLQEGFWGHLNLYQLVHMPRMNGI